MLFELRTPPTEFVQFFRISLGGFLARIPLMSKNEKQTKITAFFARDRPAKKKRKVCRGQIKPIEAPEIEMTAIEKNHEGDM